MKKVLVSAFVVYLLVSFAGLVFAAANTSTASSDGGSASAKASAEGSSDADSSEKEESKSLVPDSTAMTLGMKESSNVMPDNFRGGDPDSGLVNLLEDVYYEKHEHSLIYTEDASSLASGAKFISQPNITWETSKKGADGEFYVETSENTNVAVNGGKFFEPGEYQIGNGGAVQTECGSETKTITSNQSMGVMVYDCTAPDVWVAFQEGAGNIDMANSEKELKLQLIKKALDKKFLGRPFSAKTEDYEQINCLFIDEGEKGERDLEPWNKTARISVGGALFNPEGALKFETQTVKSALIDSAKQLRQVHLEGGEKSFFKGVFVRQNVPFIFTAISLDNFDNRKTPLQSIEARLEQAGDGEAVKKDRRSNAYLFRIPNYPRDEYKDQPEYVFVAKATDLSGNITTIRVPLYIVSTATAYEGSKNN